MLLKEAIRNRLLGDPAIVAIVGKRIFSRFAGQHKDDDAYIVVLVPSRNVMGDLSGDVHDTRSANVVIEMYDVQGDRLDKLARLVEVRLGGWKDLSPLASPKITSFLPDEGAGESEEYILLDDDSAQPILLNAQNYIAWFNNEAA